MRCRECGVWSVVVSIVDAVKLSNDRLNYGIVLGMYIVRLLGIKGEIA